MKITVLAYVVTLVVFLALDAVWLGLAARAFYQSQVGPLLLEKPQFGAAGLFYLLYVLGAVVFVVQPSLGGALWPALLRGALFGIVAYGTYDLTNLATLKGWTPAMVVVDMAWGAIGTGLAAAAAVFAAARAT